MRLVVLVEIIVRKTWFIMDLLWPAAGNMWTCASGSGSIHGNVENCAFGVGCSMQVVRKLLYHHCFFVFFVCFLTIHYGLILPQFTYTQMQSLQWTNGTSPAQSPQCTRVETSGFLVQCFMILPHSWNQWVWSQPVHTNSPPLVENGALGHYYFALMKRSSELREMEYWAAVMLAVISLKTSLCQRTNAYSNMFHLRCAWTE